MVRIVPIKSGVRLYTEKNINKNIILTDIKQINEFYILKWINIIYKVNILAMDLNMHFHVLWNYTKLYCILFSFLYPGRKKQL